MLRSSEGSERVCSLKTPCTHSDDTEPLSSRQQCQQIGFAIGFCDVGSAATYPLLIPPTEQELGANVEEMHLPVTSQL